MNNTLNDFISEHADKTYQFPELPPGDKYKQANWILNHSNVPWFRLFGIDAPYKTMLAEAQSVKHMFVGHRDEEDKHRGWRSLCVHGISATHTNIPEAYGLDPAAVKFDWTEIQEQCPATVKFFKDVFPWTEYMRVRFMLLEPGGYIMPHSDNVRSFPGGAINISLNNPEGCRLVNVHGTLPFQDTGSIFFFNNHYQHCVFNDSDTDRYHMIVHGRYDLSELAPILVSSYPKQG
jgi:hypothetical protein